MSIFRSYIPGKVKEKIVEEAVTEEDKELDDLLKTTINKLKRDDTVVKANVTTTIGDKIKVEEPPKKREVDPKLKQDIQALLKKSKEEGPKSVSDLLRKKETKIEEQITPTGVEYEDYSIYEVIFMKQFPRFELKHKDHSGIIVAKECLRKYFFREVICVIPAEETNIFYPWGTAYHIFRQRLTENYGYGPNEPKRFDAELANSAFKKASREAIEYWVKNGQDQKPGTRYDWFTTERLHKSFRVAFEHWVLEKKKGQIKVLAVEQFFTIQLADGRFVQGRIDEAIEINDIDLWGRDYKTTSQNEEWFVKGLNPNNQVKTYTFGNGALAGKKAKGIIIQAMYNDKSTKTADKGPEVYEKLIELLSLRHFISSLC